MPYRTQPKITHRDIRTRVCRSVMPDKHRTHKHGGHWVSACGLTLTRHHVRNSRNGAPCPICYPNQETAQ